MAQVAICIHEGEQYTDPICTPLVKGKKYDVIATREATNEIMIVPGDTDVDKIGWWYQKKYFRLENK